MSVGALFVMSEVTLRRRNATALITMAVLLAVIRSGGGQAAEFGTGPWVKGYTDIFGGVVPSQPGFYFRTDAYHYEAEVDRTIFNGLAQVGVEQEYTATIAALTYVTPWKILGGTYALALAPSMVAMDVNIGIGIPSFTGPLGLRNFGPSTSRSAIPISRPATPPSPRWYSDGTPASSIGTWRCSASPRPAITAGSSSPTPI